MSEGACLSSVRVREHVHLAGVCVSVRVHSACTHRCALAHHHGVWVHECEHCSAAPSHPLHVRLSSEAQPGCTHHAANSAAVLQATMRTVQKLKGNERHTQTEHHSLSAILMSYPTCAVSHKHLDPTYPTILVPMWANSHVLSH